MISNSQKEHLTYTAIGQIAVLVAIGIWTYSYVIPGLSKIDTAITNVNASVGKYAKLETNGIELTDLENILKEKPERAELSKIIQADPVGTKTAITKEGDGTYVTWLDRSIGNTEEDKKILNQEKRKLNSIIPTLSPISGNIREENLTLKEYIRYIEQSILARFHFESSMVLGLQGITFGNKELNMPESIGTFSFQIDFKGRNADIADFIAYINKAGNPELLTNTGKLTETELPAMMSNPLLTIQSFSLQNSIDPAKPNDENSGRATIRFYVRGVSKDDLLYLKENIRARHESLGKSVTESVATCKQNGSLCTYKKELMEFQEKYNQFHTASLNAQYAAQGNDEIYVLNQKITTLKTLEEELKEILPKNIKK